MVDHTRSTFFLWERPNLIAWLYDDRGQRRRHPVVVLEAEADLEGVVKQASMAKISTAAVDKDGGDGDGDRDGYRWRGCCGHGVFCQARPRGGGGRCRCGRCW
ncbi:hypothetical protein U1Q18_021679 [Sarracenia purpurea var. burkii]